MYISPFCSRNSSCPMVLLVLALASGAKFQIGAALCRGVFVPSDQETPGRRSGDVTLVTAAYLGRMYRIFLDEHFLRSSRCKCERFKSLDSGMFSQNQKPERLLHGTVNVWMKQDLENWILVDHGYFEGAERDLAISGFQSSPACSHNLIAQHHLAGRMIAPRSVHREWSISFSLESTVGFKRATVSNHNHRSQDLPDPNSWDIRP